MPRDYLHNHPQFADLMRIVAQEKGIDPALIEKDYWIMHCLYGLQQLGLSFALKGGTSLSRGFQIIDRFSEDIDIRIEPPNGHDVKTGPNHLKAPHIKSRRDFYDWLARSIKIDGIVKVERDTAFDNDDLFSAGIRLDYKSIANPVEDLRAGVLLEAGFANVTPNVPKDIGSWPMIMLLQKSASSTTGQGPSHATIQAIRWSKNCKRSRPNSASSRRRVNYRVT
jgi:hypothetical protein